MAASDPDSGVVAVFGREALRLGRFIRRRVADAATAEDILQDVFAEYVAAERRMERIEQVGAWLYRVARNRITDAFRRRRSVPFDEFRSSAREESLPPAPSALEELEGRLLEEAFADALAELPAAQREVYLAHEFDGVSFKELAARTGESVNTLLTRKHLAVRRLRERLEDG